MSIHDSKLAIEFVKWNFGWSPGFPEFRPQQTRLSSLHDRSVKKGHSKLRWIFWGGRHWYLIPTNSWRWPAPGKVTYVHWDSYLWEAGTNQSKLTCQHPAEALATKYRCFGNSFESNFPQHSHSTWNQATRKLAVNEFVLDLTSVWLFWAILLHVKHQ